MASFLWRHGKKERVLPAFRVVHAALRAQLPINAFGKVTAAFVFLHAHSRILPRFASIGKKPSRTVRSPTTRCSFGGFLSRNFAPMNMMCDWGQMFERLIYDRSKAEFEYFGLPLDAEPPP